MLCYFGLRAVGLGNEKFCQRDAYSQRPSQGAKIGVGMPVIGTPPSEPNRPISGIRLSSWWLAFKKIGVPHGKPVLRRTGPLW